MVASLTGFLQFSLSFRSPRWADRVRRLHSRSSACWITPDPKLYGRPIYWTAQRSIPRQHRTGDWKAVFTGLTCAQRVSKRF